MAVTIGGKQAVETCSVLMAVNDSSLGQIIGGHFKTDRVSGRDTNKVFPHLAGDMSEHFVTVFESYGVHGRRQNLYDRSLNFYGIIFWQNILSDKDG